MKRICLILAFLFSIAAFAGFGGGRSGGNFSGARSSSFGGSRSSGSVSISRGSSYSSRSYSAPAPTTVIHTSSGGGNGFFTGMLMGHMMSQPSTQYVNSGGQVVTEGGGLSFFGGLMVFLMIVAFILVVAWLLEVF